MSLVVEALSRPSFEKRVRIDFDLVQMLGQRFLLADQQRLEGDDKLPELAASDNHRSRCELGECGHARLRGGEIFQVLARQMQHAVDQIKGFAYARISACCQTPERNAY